MEVLYEVRGENLLIYLPEELDHHNAKTITEQSDWYIVSNQIKNIILILSEQCLWIAQAWSDNGQV